jgi:dTMP kinase
VNPNALFVIEEGFFITKHVTWEDINVKFIVFEGLDGSGKSTQVRMLAHKMETLGLPYITTRQPSDNKIGAVMRKATDGHLPLENETMALVVAADRYQHVHDEILPARKAGKYVICDRYYYSSFAFQGIDPGAYKRVAAYNELVMKHHKPDVVFFLETTPEECMRRLNDGFGGVEGYGGLYDSVAQLTEINKRYKTILGQLKSEENIVFLNGSDGKIKIAEQVLAYLNL